MLKKLLKYDLKWLLKIICIFCGIGTLFGVLSRVLELCTDSLFFDIIIAILKGTSLSLTISALFNSIIRAWVRLGSNMYKDESYLTNTLPIPRTTHYLSKCLSGLICVVLSTIVILLNVVVMYYSKDNLQFIKESLNLLSTTLDVSIVWFVILLFIVVLLEALFILQCGYFGIIYGNTLNKNKILNSFIFGFVGYMISTIMFVVILIIGSLFNEGLSGVILGGSKQVEFGVLKGIMIYVCVLYVIYIGVFYYLNYKSLKKGINID